MWSLSSRIPQSRARIRRLPISRRRRTSVVVGSRRQQPFLDFSSSTRLDPLGWNRFQGLPQRFFSTREAPSRHDDDHEFGFSKLPAEESKSDAKAQKSRKSKPRTKRPKIDLFQLSKLDSPHSREHVEEWFEQMARKNDLGRLKWIPQLRQQLDKHSNDPSSSLTASEIIQKFFQSRKSISLSIQQQFWDLLLAKPFDRKVTASGDKKNHSLKQTSTDDNPKSSTLRKHALILVQARQQAVEFPFFWSASRQRKLKGLYNQQEAGSWSLRRYNLDRREELESIHSTKSEDQEFQEALDFANLLSDSLPSTAYTNVMRLFEDYASTLSAKGETKGTTEDVLDEGHKGKPASKSKRIRMLYTHLNNCLPSHIHLIAPKAAEFFYVNVPHSSLGENAEDSLDMISLDQRVVKSHQKWDSIKASAVEALLAIQSQLLEEDSVEKSLHLDSSTKVSGEDKEIGLVSSGESLASVQKKKLKAEPRLRLVYDALLLGQWATASRKASQFDWESLEPHKSPLFPSSPPSKRMVFIDNLPIDVHLDRVKEVYSRCGKVEALELFQLRPDLDPGRVAKHSKKQIRPAGKRGAWTRSRTPVYGVILFEDEAGYETAVSDPLRIFGMVLDKHLIRSHRPRDMTTLYIENISSNHDVTSIEYQLSQILHPQLYVCLDMDASHRSRRTKNEINCAIKFPNFEAAYWAYLKLSQELELLDKDDCKLHWMETPHDAMLYWTRQLNF